MSSEKALKLVVTDAKPETKPGAGVPAKKVKDVKPAEAVTVATVPAPITPFTKEIKEVRPPVFHGVKQMLPTGAIVQLAKDSGQTNAKFGELRDKRGDHFRSRALLETKKEISEIYTDREYSLKDFEKEEHGVFVLGLKLKPIKTDILAGDGKLGPVISLPEELGGHWFNYRVHRNQIPEGTSFDLYQFELEGHVHTFLVDKESKVWIDHDITGQMVSPWSNPNAAIDHKQGSGVIMHKAVATDCTFYNLCMLLGGEYSRSVISDSTVISTPKPETSEPWGPFPSNGRSNLKISGVYLERSTISRSSIERGQYFQAHIYDSTIDSRAHIQVREATVRNSTLRGTERLVLDSCNLDRVHIGASGQVQLANQSLNDFTLRSESLYATNKLAITQIDMPHSRYREIQLVRVDRDTMEVSGAPSGERFKFRLDKDRWELSSELDEWLNKAMANGMYDTENSKASDDPLMASMIRYVSETIQSRIRVIKTATSVIDMADNLETKDSTRNFNSWGSGPF